MAKLSPFIATETGHWIQSEQNINEKSNKSRRIYEGKIFIHDLHADLKTAVESFKKYTLKGILIYTCTQPYSICFLYEDLSFTVNMLMQRFHLTFITN